jgi:hypothetical protein
MLSNPEQMGYLLLCWSLYLRENGLFYSGENHPVSKFFTHYTTIGRKMEGNMIL